MISNSISASDLTRHDAEIHENLRHWNRKPVLREVYADFYREISRRLDGCPQGQVVECGSGIGNIKGVLPDCLTTDLFPNPWIDQTEDVYALSFADASVAAFILFDVFHHLEFPGVALAELHRALKPSGRLVMFEPAPGLFGRIVLGLFHHEPFNLGKQIAWSPPAGWSRRSATYYSAQGNAWRIFRCGEHADRLAGWRLCEVAYRPALPWLLCGGFRGPQLCPGAALPLARAVDRVFAIAPALFASRMLIVLEKPVC